MKEEGRASKAPVAEALGNWRNGRLVLLALLGLTAGQGVVWYTGQFLALFFLTQTLKVDPQWANIIIALSLVIGTPFFVFFWVAFGQDRPEGHHHAWLPLGGPHLLSNRHPETYSRRRSRELSWNFELLTETANPELAAAIQKTPVDSYRRPG